MAATGRGSAMRMRLAGGKGNAWAELEPSCGRGMHHERGRGKKVEDSQIAEVRRLLRGDDSIEEIANALGVSRAALVNFIHRRAICNLAWRERMRKFKKLKALQEPSWSAKVKCGKNTTGGGADCA